MSRTVLMVRRLRPAASDEIALFALSPNRPPDRVIAAADLSAAEWALFAEMVRVVTHGRLVIDPLPPFPTS